MAIRILRDSINTKKQNILEIVVILLNDSV